MSGPRPELPGRIQAGPCWRDHMGAKAPRATRRESEEAEAEAEISSGPAARGCPHCPPPTVGGRRGPGTARGLAVSC